MSENDGQNTDTTDDDAAAAAAANSNGDGGEGKTPDPDAGAEGAGADGGAGEGASGQGEGANGEGDGPYWREDWRERMAEHAAAGDQKAYDRELKRLQRYSDPAQIYAARRELENTFNSGNLVKLPGEDATEEEIANYRTAIGVPETADGYLDVVGLNEGLQIGEADLPNLDSFLTQAHDMGASPQFVEGALNWYFQTQADLAAEIDEGDDKRREDGLSALREEYGTKLTRLTNATDSIYAQSAPGGADRSNPHALISRMAGARFADGSLVADDADYRRFMIAIAQDRGLGATEVEDYGDDGKNIDTRLEELRKLRTTDKRKYYSAEVQAEEQELLAAKDRRDERASA